jgi:hypothetical protein
MSEHRASPPPVPQTPHAPHAPNGNESLRPPPARGNLPNAGVSAFRAAVEQPPISLVGEADTHTAKIQAFGVAGSLAHQSTWKRATTVTGTGAIRVRTFHGRLSDEGLAYMDEKINQWLDEHDDIEVKLVTTSIGIYETKSKDPALIVNVWY